MSSDEEVAAVEEPLHMDNATGLPHMSENAKSKGRWGMMSMMPLLLVVPRLVTGGIAFAIYYCGDRMAHDTSMKSFMALFGSRIGYLYIAAGVYSMAVQWLNVFPMLYKASVMPGSAGNLRANMHIYKVNKPLGDSQLPYVVLEEEGDVGVYNRANRALFHFVENSAALGVCILLSGLIFPLEVLVLVACYGAARIWYQIAYATGGYGSGCCKHSVPFAVSSMIIAPTIEMLCWVCGVRMLMWKSEL